VDVIRKLELGPDAAGSHDAPATRGFVEHKTSRGHQGDADPAVWRRNHEPGDNQCDAGQRAGQSPAIVDVPRKKVLHTEK